MGHRGDPVPGWDWDPPQRTWSLDVSRSVREIKPAEDQQRYARVAHYMESIGVTITVVGFVLYASGLLSSSLPIQEVPNYWAMRVADFVRTTNMPRGWRWLSHLHQGDGLSVLGLFVLASATPVCLLSIVPILVSERDLPYVIIVLIQVAVLVTAASGILRIG